MTKVEPIGITKTLMLLVRIINMTSMKKNNVTKGAKLHIWWGWIEMLILESCNVKNSNVVGTKKKMLIMWALLTIVRN